MQLLLGIALFAASALAADCGAHGDFKPGYAHSFSPSVSSAYDCGRSCAVTTSCQSFVFGPQGCAFVSNSVDNFWVVNASSPIQAWQKYSCDYTTLRVTPVLTIPTPTPSGSICGVKGWDNANPGSYYSYVEAAYQTFGGCFLQCQDRGINECKAFAIGSGACLLYNVKMAGDINPGDTAPNTFYDMDCVKVVTGSVSASQAPATSAPVSSSVAAVSPVVSTTATPVTSSAPSVCSVNGVAGYDKQSPAAYVTDSQATTLPLCSSKCKSDSKCQGFAVGGGLCLLYASSMANNVAASSGSPYIFYDLGCVATTSGAVSSVSVVATPATLSTSTLTSSSVAASATGKTCAFKGFETSNADASIVGYKYKPAAGCKAFCTAKSALSYEQYYDYCICFNKAVTAVATANTTSPVVFNDITC